MDKDLATKLLSDVVAALDRHGVEYWLDYGTLLGAVRQNDFIDDDMDIDIGIFADQTDRLEKVLIDLSQHGLDFSPDYFSGMMRKANIVVHDLKGGFAKLELVPVYFQGYKYYKLTREEGEQIYGAGTPHQLLSVFRTVMFKGSWVRIPAAPEKLLEYYYLDWKTPRVDIAQSYKNPFELLDKNKILQYWMGQP